ncbi:MAG: M28 family metallopeptidase [Methanomassiliicoccales archaeon]|nr:M28 family metallopeptidase [Methanomassiliicoccales archaeon]
MTHMSARSTLSLLLGASFIGMALLGAVPVHGESVSAIDDQVKVDGPSIWSNATALEQIGASYPAYRCAGSAGANSSADWILSRFQDLGLESWKEGFEFHSWDLSSDPTLHVSCNNGSSINDATLTSFAAEHFSASTPPGGAEGEVIVLPLPSTSSYNAFAALSFDAGSWQDINIQDRIVLVGREVRWNVDCEEGLVQKLHEGPAALVFFYSQSWTSSFEVMFSASSGGRPLSGLGSYFHDRNVPVGSLGAEDADWVLERLEEGNVSGRISIESREGIWTQQNVVAFLPGGFEGSEQVLLTAHYDSVMDPGFCDNAASVATLIEVASKLVAMKESGDLGQTSSIGFIAFTGEELGLVGSDYYFAMHASELNRVKAVINIDCLGAGTMTRTSTEPYKELDLDGVVDRFAEEVGIASNFEDGSSDHSSFMYPSQVAMQIDSRWGMGPQIDLDAEPVTGAISIFSSPLTLLDPYAGFPGWIHTSRDSSSFCSSSGWVTEGNLEDQGSVVLAVCLDLIVEAQSSDGINLAITPVLAAFAFLVVAAVILVLVLLLRRRSL